MMDESEIELGVKDFSEAGIYVSIWLSSSQPPNVHIVLPSYSRFSKDFDASKGCDTVPYMLSSLWVLLLFYLH